MKTHWVVYDSKYLFLYFLTEDAQLTPVLRLGAGACAGIIAMSATYPMDMVRGRITVQVLCYFNLMLGLVVIGLAS